MGYIHRRRSKIINKNTIELELKGSDLNGVFIWSEWGDLNPRPLGPEPSALPAALHPVSPPIIFPNRRAVKYYFTQAALCKSQALNAHNFSLLVLSNFDKPTWPPSCPMVGSLRVFLFCSPCSAPLTSSPFDCPLCWFLPVTRSAQSPAGTPGT